MNFEAKNLTKRVDARGMLVEIIRPEDIGYKKFGQITLTTARPGHTKGNHFHARKTEWYCVIKGKGLLSLVDNNTNKRTEIMMSDKNMMIVKIPPNYFHFIKNIGRTEMYLLVYCDESFDTKDPDTFYE